jgi:hypothetical protein
MSDHALDVTTEPILANVLEFAGVPAKEVRSIPPDEYDMFEKISQKLKGGVRGMVDLIIYVGFLALFVALQMTNNAVMDDITMVSNGVNVPISGSLTFTNSTIYQVMLIGVGLSIIRVVLADMFVKEAQMNRIIEIVFGVIMLALFITALVISVQTQNQLNNLTGITDAGHIKGVSLAKSSISNQITYMVIGLIGASVLSIYNVYDFFRPVEIDASAPEF